MCTFSRVFNNSPSRDRCGATVLLENPVFWPPGSGPVFFGVFSRGRFPEVPGIFPDFGGFKPCLLGGFWGSPGGSKSARSRLPSGRCASSSRHHENISRASGKKNYLSRKISRPENCYMVTRRSSDSDDRIGDDGDRKRGRAAPGSWRATWSILVGDVEDRLARTSETRSERQRVEHRGSPFLAELRSGQGNAPDATCWRRGGPLQDRSYSRPVRKRT